MAFSFNSLSPFQQQQQQQQPSPFQPQQQQSPFQLQPQQQQPQPQPQLYLFTNDKSPATYSTKWADLHPDSQKVLLQIEERILEYRGESQRLDQCSRLFDSSVSSNGFEIDATYIVKELGAVSIAMERQKSTVQDLLTVVKEMLRNTEIAVRSFMMLHPRFLHQNQAGPTDPSQPPGATAVQTPGSQAAANPAVQVYDFYSGLPSKPSPYLQQTVVRFDNYLSDCRKWIEELEQLLLHDSERNSLNPSSSLLQSLPKVLTNVYDFFVHVAAKVESIHQYIESMKTAYMADLRRLGDESNPFLEADRRETAKQEAAARRVHPTLHLPSSQTTTQVSGPLPISGPPVTSTAATGSGPSLFSTPAAASSTPSLFSTPAPSTPFSSLFGTAATPQASPFGSTPLVGSSPASGISNFSTPFPTGAAAGSGASFGTISKARGKSRPGRR